jgi:hypothetical protein
MDEPDVTEDWKQKKNRKWLSVVLNSARISDSDNYEPFLQVLQFTKFKGFFRWRFLESRYWVRETAATFGSTDTTIFRPYTAQTTVAVHRI